MDDGVNETRPPFVDAHFHLWDREVLRYPWLERTAVKGVAGLDRLLAPRRPMTRSAQ